MSDLRRMSRDGADRRRTEKGGEGSTVFINDDGIRLNVKLDRPGQSGGKCPLVIVIHGFTGHMEETHITAVSKAFNELGCATQKQLEN